MLSKEPRRKRAAAKATSPRTVDASSPFVTPPGLPDVEPLTPKTFAALPRTKISALFTKADRSSAPLLTRCARLTNCASYLVCIGSLGVAVRRSSAVLEPTLKLALGEAMFAYQLDWRYPKPFGITMTDLDAAKPEVALRRAYAEPFFSLLERNPSYFACESAYPSVAYMVTLTRHLLGKQTAAYDAWLAAVIERLTKLATNPAPKASIYLHHYPSQKAWQAAVDVRHGRALPLELLDLSREVPPTRQWPALVAATVARMSPRTNPLLRRIKRA